MESPPPEPLRVLALSPAHNLPVNICLDLAFNLQGHPRFHVQVCDLKFVLEQQKNTLFLREPTRNHERDPSPRCRLMPSWMTPLPHCPHGGHSTLTQASRSPHSLCLALLHPTTQEENGQDRRFTEWTAWPLVMVQSVQVTHYPPQTQTTN